MTDLKENKYHYYQYHNADERKVVFLTLLIMIVSLTALGLFITHSRITDPTPQYLDMQSLHSYGTRELAEYTWRLNAEMEKRARGEK